MQVSCLALLLIACTIWFFYLLRASGQNKLQCYVLGVLNSVCSALLAFPRRMLLFLLLSTQMDGFTDSIFRAWCCSGSIFYLTLCAYNGCEFCDPCFWSWTSSFWKGRMYLCKHCKVVNTCVVLWFSVLTKIAKKKLNQSCSYIGEKNVLQNSWYQFT